MDRTTNLWYCARTLQFFVLFGLVLTSIQAHVLEFTVEPRDTVVMSGSSAVLDCAARSTEYPKKDILIQWHDQEGQPVTFIGDTYRSQLTNGSLYISSVVEGQGLTGSYQCKAVLPNVGSIVSRIANVTLASLSGFLEEPRDIMIFHGQKAYFACRVQATPPARVRWLKDERPLQLDEVRMTVLPSGALEIDEVQYSDMGTYRCNASGLNQYRLSNKATLTISSDLEAAQSISPPEFIATPRSQEVIEGQTITLDCATNGHPKPWVSWLKDGVNLEMADLDSRYRKVSGTSSLQITNIQEADAGTYQCRAGNKEDSSDATATITVLVPPKFLVKPVDKIDALHKDAEFECRIYGKPEPKVQWLKNGEVISYGDYFKLDNGHNLKILGTLDEDAGIFQCVGSNPAGNVQASARLKISGSATNKRKKVRNNGSNMKKPLEDLDSNKKPTKSQLRSYLTSLKADSIGKAEFGHSQPHSQTKEYTMTADKYAADQNFDQSLKTFAFNSLRSSDDNDTNNPTLGPFLPVYTDSPLYMNLTDGATLDNHNDGLPGKPQDLKAVIVKARFVTLSWKSPDITNGDILAYTVFYRVEGSQRERTRNTTLSRLEEANINGLIPSRVYHFRVVAINHVGSGPSSDSLKVVTQPEEHVPSAPLYVSAHATSPTSVHVSWREPKITNGHIEMYKIFYMESETSVERSKDTTGLSFDLIGLSMFTEYNIWVVAVNEKGVGASSLEVVVRTYGSTPSEPPHNVTVEPGSSTSIVIRWEPPPIEGQNGIITGYKIRYRKRDRKGDTITTPGNSRMYTLLNLERSSQYQIRICAINVNGSGPPTDWLNAETFENDLDEDKVPEEPSPLKVRPASDSITISWSPPASQNIKVRKYIVGWGLGVPDNVMQELDEKQRVFVIENLEPNSEYVISLRASNNVGPSPVRYATVRTRDELPPDPVVPLLPPVGLKAQVISANAVVLYWTDATLSKSQYVTDNRYYVVRYGTPTATNVKQRTYNSSELNCMIVDLKPNTLYEFTVKVVRGKRESPWSMVVQNTTMAAAPSTPPRDLTIVKSDENTQIVTLTWQPPKQSNGPITGYILLYSTDNTKHDRNWLVEGIVGDKHVTQLHNLQPRTTYFFKIQARNNKGNGPFSQIVSFRTGEHVGIPLDSRLKDGKTGPFSNTMMLYFIIGGSIIAVTVIAVIIIVVCCKRRDPNATPDRTKKGYQKGMPKNQNIKPPDLWIHHDQMELKALEKGHSSNDGASSSGAMTLPRSVGANDYDSRDTQPCNSLDKRTYAPSYMGVPNDDKNRRVVKPKPITLPVESKPPREPIATATPINTSLNQSIGSDLSRPPYPRTQYSISRAHVTLDQNALVPNTPTGSVAPMSLGAESPYAMQSAYDSVLPPPGAILAGGGGYAGQQQPQPPPPLLQTPQPPIGATYAPGMNVLADAQGGKRLQGHPLKSFSVPAPPPTSAPGTPQAKHVVTVRPNSSPYKKAPSSGSGGSGSGGHGTPTSRISASNPPPHTAEEVQRLAPSYSTEELNQEMANLEGLMKDLNAITASEFELG